MKKLSCIFAAAAAVLTLLSSCTEKIQPSIEEQDGPLIFSVKATKADALTKALSFDGNNIAATWADGESVQVFKGEENLGTIYPETYGASSTTLTGELKSGVVEGDNLTLVFNTNNYSNQEGTLAYIAANCDYATASVTVAPRVAGDPITSTAPASFANQQAIVKFTLQDAVGSTLNATALTIQCGSSTISLSGLSGIYDTTVNGPGVVYVAIPGCTSQEVTLTATYSGKEYIYKKSGVTFTNGNYHRISVKLFNELASPLTFEAMEAGATIAFTKGSNLSDFSVQYSTNGSTWTNYTSGVGITLTAVGDKVMFRGTSQQYASWENTPGSTFTCSKNCYIYGNVMSLIGGEDFVNVLALPANYTFKDLFNGNTHIKNHSYKTLALPATTLTPYCYQNMFIGCTGLTEAPALPASTVSVNSYLGMFQGCTNLTTAPSLPATELADNCYQNMFYGCSSLTTAPEELPASTVPSQGYYCMFADCISLITAPKLPATSVGQSAYEHMFSGCTSLTTVPVFSATSVGNSSCRCMFLDCTSLNSFPESLPATTLAYACYEQMFLNCTSLTSTPLLPATNIAQRCYVWMFKGCKNITTAPALEATVLASQCYEGMFWDCINLTTAPALPATTIAYSCYESMFYGCKELISVPTTLPATNLTGANRCYCGMFQGCIKLTTAPQLPATTLANSCYSSMFYGCTELASAPQLPATTLANSCYESMFYGCTELASAPELPATTLAESCYSHMFSSCTSLTKSPILPAGVLVTNCYNCMFSYCSKLSEVTCLATAIAAENTEECTNWWLYQVKNSGNFITYDSASIWTPNSISGIPSGWTRVDY